VTVLLDGNVLVALSVADHVHHEAAATWFSSTTSPFATTPGTQGTLLRFLIRAGMVATDAFSVMEGLRRHPRHQFWPDDLPYEASMLRTVVGHRQVTDAYLVAVARARGGRVATLDRGMAAAHPDDTVAIPVASGASPDATPSELEGTS
jgi:toxin-antitoxin system PIN domain toxin